jgi:hypothetical protein
MDLKLAGKSALVMGGSKGLGRAIAAELIAEGVRVAIASRDATRVSQAAGELGALGFTADLTLPAPVARRSSRRRPCWAARRTSWSPTREARSRAGSRPSAARPGTRPSTVSG